MPSVRSNSPVHQSPTPAPNAEPAPVEANSLAVAMIQALIPLGLQAVEDALQQEVLALAGPRYAHADGRPAIARWGAQAGSVFLADQNAQAHQNSRTNIVEARCQRFIPTVKSICGGGRAGLSESATALRAIDRSPSRIGLRPTRPISA